MADDDDEITADQRGASLVEYALLISLIALVAAAAVVLLGGATGDQISSAANLFPD
jgi:Flp pilus assembly pilin Flp